MERERIHYFLWDNFPGAADGWFIIGKTWIGKVLHLLMCDRRNLK